MSNPLNARRVMFQNLDENGNPIGVPSFGVIVSSNESTSINNSFESFKGLNAAIEENGCIAHLCEDFVTEVDPMKVGTENFYGKDWAFGFENHYGNDLEDDEAELPDAPIITDESIRL